MPVAPKAGSESKKLEDVPFEGDTSKSVWEQTNREMGFKPVEVKEGFWSQFFGRGNRRREKLLESELTELKANYASLLSMTEDIRERMDYESEQRREVQKALTPFPAAFEGIEQVRSRQEEVGQVLHTIREQVGTSHQRDEQLLGGFDVVTGEVERVQTGVTKVSSGVEEVSTGVRAVSTDVQKVSTGVKKVSTGIERVEVGVLDVQSNLGQLGDRVSGIGTGVERMEMSFERIETSVGAIQSSFGSVADEMSQAVDATHDGLNNLKGDMEDLRKATLDSREKMEQSNEDVAFMVKKLSKSSSRGQWILGGLIAALLVIAAVVALKMGEAGGVRERVEIRPEGSRELLAAGSEALVFEN
ncbi:MAG: hypothetical protein AAGC74_06515 [Verrucomicrobiota bacterium]